MSNHLLKYRFRTAEVNRLVPSLSYAVSGNARPLDAEACIDAMGRLPRLPGNLWVIYGIRPRGHLSDLQPFWQPLRARAGLNDARIHDLRHTFASAAVAAGQGLRACQ